MEPREESVIIKKLNDLAFQASELERVLDILDGITSSVRLSHPRVEEKDEGKSESTCELGGMIDAVKERVKKVVDKLKNIIHELEI